MKRLVSFVVVGGLVIACGGDVFDPGSDGGTSDAPSNKDAPVYDEGLDSPVSFSCGDTTCSGADAVCIHSCCGGAIECAPYEDGGMTCPPGLEYSATCPSQAPCSNVCKPPPPACGTSKDCPMVQGHDCYLVCA